MTAPGAIGIAAGRGGRRRRPPLLAAAAAVWLAGAPPVYPEIAFSALRDGTWRVHVQQGPGAPPRIVEPDLVADATAPAVSPDGRWIAFELAASGVRVCALDGSVSCRTVRQAVGWAARPSWNPATGELLFVGFKADAEGEDSDIYAADPATGEVRLLLRHSGVQDFPAVSPDGRRLVYGTTETVGLVGATVHVVRQLWLLDLETGVPRRLLDGSAHDLHPAWAPGGDWIAFASDRGGDFDLWMVRPDGRDLRRLTSGPGLDQWPAWAPGGDELLFSRAEAGRQQLHRLHRRSGKTTPFEPFGAGGEIPTKDPNWK